MPSLMELLSDQLRGQQPAVGGITQRFTLQWVHSLILLFAQWITTTSPSEIILSYNSNGQTPTCTLTVLPPNPLCLLVTRTHKHAETARSRLTVEKKRPLMKSLKITPLSCVHLRASAWASTYMNACAPLHKCSKWKRRGWTNGPIECNSFFFFPLTLQK